MTFSIEILPSLAPDFAGLTYPRYRHVLTEKQPQDLDVIALGARVEGKPVGLALIQHLTSYRETSEATTRLYSIFVAKDHRRKGIGRALIEHALASASQASSFQLLAEYSNLMSNQKGFERFLAASGWEPPKLLELRLGALAECTKDLAVAWAPMMKRAKRKGYASTLWCEITPEDRKVAQKLAENDPFARRYPFWQYEKHIDPKLSLALRLNGELVGWVLAQTPEDQAHHHYVAGFVRQDLQSAGWLAIGIFDASQLQYDQYGPKSLTLYETQGDNPKMITFMKRRQAFVTEWMDERYVCCRKVSSLGG